MTIILDTTRELLSDASIQSFTIETEGERTKITVTKKQAFGNTPTIATPFNPYDQITPKWTLRNTTSDNLAWFVGSQEELDHMRANGRFDTACAVNR